MALDDRDLFMAICNKYPDQKMDFIMDQYEKAKLMNLSIERKISEAVVQPAPDPAAEEVVEVVETAAEVTPPKKRYTKRMLKVKPQDAVTDDVIFCCICGEPKQNLTVTHLKGHDITPEDYRKLCDYPPKMPLMSKKRLAKSKEVIVRAQKARLAKRKAEAEN